MRVQNAFIKSNFVYSENILTAGWSFRVGFTCVRTFITIIFIVAVPFSYGTLRSNFRHNPGFAMHKHNPGLRAECQGMGIICTHFIMAGGSTWFKLCLCVCGGGGNLFDPTFNQFCLVVTILKVKFCPLQIYSRSNHRLPRKSFIICNDDAMSFNYKLM